MHYLIHIYPPVSKPSEPPAGIARLSGFLKHHGVKQVLLDANLEGLMYLLKSAGMSPDKAQDTWSRRALLNWPQDIATLKDGRSYAHIDRYKRAVSDIGRVLEIS